MGRPIDTHNTIVKMPDVAKIRNVEQQRGETQRRQFALALQEKAARKETQVQTSHRSESPEIHEEAENKKKRKGQSKRKRGESPAEASEQENVGEGLNPSRTEQHHIDIKID